MYVTKMSEKSPRAEYILLIIFIIDLQRSEEIINERSIIYLHVSGSIRIIMLQLLCIVLV